MGCAVVQFEKEVSFRLGTGEEYSGTPLYGHPLNTDTCFIRTVSFVPTKSSYIFSKINPLYTDTG